MEKVSSTGVKKIYAPVSVVETLSGFKTVAHLMQEIVSIYPGRRMSNNKSTGLFDQPEDGQKFNATRHCLIPVPEGITMEEVASQLSKFPNGVIQRVVTNNIEDILTDGDIWAMNNTDENGKPYTTLEQLKDKYETRDKEGNRFSNGIKRVDAAIGTVLDDTLPEEFTRNFYQREFVEDLDLRTPVEVTAKESVLTA